jgi:hypothetical protein
MATNRVADRVAGSYNYDGKAEFLVSGEDFNSKL